MKRYLAFACETSAGVATASHLVDHDNSGLIHSNLWRNLGAHQLDRTSSNKYLEPGAVPVTSIKTNTYSSPSAFERQIWLPDPDSNQGPID